MDRCPKCGAMRDHCTERHASHGGRFYVCGTFVTSDGAASVEGVACLRRQLAAANERAVHVYNSGYAAGHHDTVEGTFIDIANCDMDTYHEDVVRELLAGLAAKANREGK